MMVVSYSSGIHEGWQICGTHHDTHLPLCKRIKVLVDKGCPIRRIYAKTRLIASGLISGAG